MLVITNVNAQYFNWGYTKLYHPQSDHTYILKDFLLAVSDNNRL